MNICPVTAQSLVPGIHGMSIIQGVRFTSVNVTGEKEISFNLKFLGSGPPPPVLIVATALTNGTDYRPDATTTMGGSQILNTGWSSPKSVAMKIIGNASLYDADLVTVVASPPEASGSTQNTAESTPPENTKSEALNVLSTNSFIDSISYLHVVGEVENNTPNVAKFVKVTGTFYNKGNEVVATDFTFTSPQDIAPGDKAPFEIVLTSASIPLSEIDHNRIIASSQ